MIEQLKQDLSDMIKRMPDGPLVSAADMRKYMADDMLPFLVTLVDEVGEMDDTIDTLAHQSEDILHSESAAVFAGLIVAGRTLMAELKKRAAKEPELLAQIGAWSALSEQAERLLEDITLEEEEEESDEPADDDGEAETDDDKEGDE